MPYNIFPIQQNFENPYTVSADISQSKMGDNGVVESQERNQHAIH